MILGASAIITRLLEILGISLFSVNGESSIYGMSSYERYSPLALFITSLLVFKGITAFSMWMEREWAIKMAIIDAILGIIICIITMFILPMVEKESGRTNINFRFELLLLIPYLIKCLKIKKAWSEIEFLKEQRLNPKSNNIIPVVQKEEIEPINDFKEVKQEESEEDKLDKEDYRRFMPK